MDEYLLSYPVSKKSEKLLFYKSVKKNGEKYYSDYNSAFEYVIGNTYEEKVDKNPDEDCGRGLHVAYKDWALRFGNGWENRALLEVLVDPKDIFVSNDTDGKVRTSKLKVLRVVPEGEY